VWGGAADPWGVSGHLICWHVRENTVERLLAESAGVVASWAAPQRGEPPVDLHGPDEPAGCGYAAFLQNAGFGWGGTQRVALGWYAVSRWDTGWRGLSSWGLL
jgi:hypothetical protein